MILIWIGVSIFGVAATVLLGMFLFYWYLRIYYGPFLVRGFEETPLFIVPRGKPVDNAEDVRFKSFDGLQLQGCYLRSRCEKRLGVIMFGLEFRSNRWACVQYCEKLLEAGFDIFTFETRNQGDSEAMADYQPLQWITNVDVEDTRAALAYLKARPDADPRGIGLFGISKGGSAGLYVAASDPYVRCFVTDGAFATWTTLVPYMRKWIAIYSKQHWLQTLVPSWYYAMVGQRCVARRFRDTGITFPMLERLMIKLAPRPLLMIHGGDDSYIKPAMGRSLFDRARQPKEFWLVEGAKHNQALHIAGDAYHERVVSFFRKHLGGKSGSECTVPAEDPASGAGLDAEQNGHHHREETERRRDEENHDVRSSLALYSQEAASPPR